MTDLNSSSNRQSLGRRQDTPLLLCGLRRRWKIGVIAFLLLICGVGLFFDLVWGLVLGTIAGIVLPLLLENLDRTIKRVDDVYNKLDLPVLGTLPCLPIESGHDSQPERRLITAFSPQESGAKSYRDLCGALRSFNVGEKGQVIMVTSCIPGEGKSTVSANLAVTLAEGDTRVLLVGCDLRRPTLCELFGETHQPGLSDLLSGDDNSGLRKLTAAKIDFLPAGEIPPNPAELLDSDRMRDFLASVRDDYDYVVLDAPPVLAVTDSQLLAPLCDLRLMVMEPCRIPLPMARKLIETQQSVGASIDGVILNDRSGRAAKHYGGSGEYGREAEAVKNRAVGNVSPVGKWLVGTALFLAMVIAGLSWQVLRQEKSADRVKVATADSSFLAGKEKTDPPVRLPARKALPVVQEEQTGLMSNPVTKISEPPQDLSIEEVSTQPSIETEGKGSQEVDIASSELSEPPADAEAQVVAEKDVEKKETKAKPVEKPAERSVAGTQPGPVVKPATRTVAKTTTRTTARTTASTTTRTTVKGLQPALVALARSWQRTLPDKSVFDHVDVEGGMKELGLLGNVLGPDLSVSLQCGTPLLLEIDQEKTGTNWITVVGRRGYKWQVAPPLRQGELFSEPELKRLWTGKGYMPWQDPLHLLAIDTGDGKQMGELQRLLVQAGYLKQFEKGVYDRETIKAIGRLQANSGLAVNGRITPETLVLLYQADPSATTPKFKQW